MAQIAYLSIFGRPLIMYIGIITVLSLLFTASINVLPRYGIQVLPYQWHPRFGAWTILIALIHGVLAISAYF